MRSTKVASRYAKALLDLALEKSSADKVKGDMDQLVQVSAESRDFQNLLSSPIIDPSKKNSIYDAIFGKSMDQISLGFMKLITKNSRENILPQIAESYVALYKKHNNILDVHITSAQPLENSAREKILAKVKGAFQGTIELHEDVDASLIGGFIVRIDDKQIDASIASQLRNLNNILLN